MTPTTGNISYTLPVVVLLNICLLSCDDNPGDPVAPAHAPTPTAPSSAKTEPAVIMFVSGFSDKGHPIHIIFSAESDGRVLWSQNRLEGGGTLNEATLSQDRLAKLRDRLTAIAGGLGKSHVAYTGPDAAVTAIQFEMTGGGRASFSSWHELAEANDAVATWRGLQGRGAPGASDDQSPAAATYAQFRGAWSELRKVIDEAMRDAERQAPILAPSSEGLH